MASPVKENPNLKSKKYFNMSLPIFCRGQGIKTLSEIMETVLQCLKCVFWPLKWSKVAIVVTVRASQIQENSILKSKRYFNMSLTTFFRGQGIKTLPEIMKTVLQCVKYVFWLIKQSKLTIFVTVRASPTPKKRKF